MKYVQVLLLLFVTHAVFAQRPLNVSRTAFQASRDTDIRIHASRFDSTKAVPDTGREFVMQVMENGLQVWSRDSTRAPYHNMMQIWRPGFAQWGVTRNVHGLTMFETPMLIDTAPRDFTNLAHVHPTLGDGQTWMLAVNGPALFKEAFVNTNDWPDYVFSPAYSLMPLDDFETYVHAHHHLPCLPSADSMSSGIPLGKTQAALTKQVEELSLYILELHRQLDALKAKVDQLEQRPKE